jgi:glucose/arabinose dehydrogenase
MNANRALLVGLLVVLQALVFGCARGPQLVTGDAQKPVDRTHVEFPNGYLLKPFARGLNAPSAIAFVTEEGEYHGSILVAESGAGGSEPRIYGFKPDGTHFSIYPYGRQLPRLPGISELGIFKSGREIHGPIGGMVVTQGRIIVTHRDSRGAGVVSSLGFDGSGETIVADLPAQGDHSVTDAAVHPTSGRIYFGLGSATNSGVVGIDNWQVGWVKRRMSFCDQPATSLKLLGFKFLTKNPNAGIFGGDDNVETAPFQPFGFNNQLRIRKARNDKPTAAIFSISPSGGDLRIEAWGIRHPRGLAFNEYANLFATNNGMELRGSRPVQDDKDVLLRILQGTWYGWPDFSADLVPISDPRFLPAPEIMNRTGYPELSFVIDHATSNAPSGLPTPSRDLLVYGVFPSLSGAAKLDFVPSDSAFRDFRYNAIVALSGDRAPFATSGQKLKAPVGYKVVRVDLENRRIEDFIRNTRDMPASRVPRKDTSGASEALERPIDVKFGPDGKLYILDFGKLELRNGREKITPGSGRIFVLEPMPQTAAK